MNIDFHYYATYCAAILAGYSHDESLKVCYSAQFVDHCTRTLLSKLGAPLAAATTQLNLELMNASTDLVGLQDITRIWSSFHFLPRDLNAVRRYCGRLYRSKYRLICGPNGPLIAETVELAKGRSLQAVGLAMHVMADTWAHTYFAGTPSLVINNTNYYFYEILPEGERKITFRHSTTKPDDLDNSIYTCCLYQYNENSIMNLGHGRAGHLPDYSFIRYKYLPAWKDYDEIIKDNPADYYRAFCQMVYAMQYLRRERETFVTDCYAWDTVKPYAERIWSILETRRLDDSEDWAAFGKELSGEDVPPFDLTKYQDEYIQAEEKNETFLGKFLLAALAQKSMVTNRIFRSGNLLAGFSVDYDKKGFMGIKDFKLLIEMAKKGEDHE